VAAGWDGLIAVNPDGSGRSLLCAGSGLVAPADYGQYRCWAEANRNACRPLEEKRHVTNVRQSFKEIDDRHTPPREMSLDQCIEYLNTPDLGGRPLR